MDGMRLGVGGPAGLDDVEGGLVAVVHEVVHHAVDPRLHRLL